MTKTGFSGDNSPSSLSTSWRSDLNINVLKNKKKGKSIKKKKKNENAMNIDKTYVFVSSRLGNSLLLGLSTETTDSKDDNDNTKKRTNDTIKTETNSAKKRNRKEDDAEDGKYFIAKRACIAYMESTVVDISIPPPSFKPVPLSSPCSPFSKTPKQVFFNPYKIYLNICHTLYSTIINSTFFRLTFKILFLQGWLFCV